MPHTGGPENPTNRLNHRIVPRVDAPAIGERIGRYEVLRVVASGGMATVYAVRDTHDGLERALKLLTPMEHEDEALERFRREFRALSRMHHPGVLQVFESGLWEGRPWYTMELVNGRTLHDEVATWAELSPDARCERTRRVIVQLGHALAYVHDRGIVHRDLTPANIMIEPSGRVRVMDFGVIKGLGAELTAVGELLGTVAWIAPEQISGALVDARADLYSLGAILYWMVAGSRPFKARSIQGYLELHLHQVPRPLTDLQPHVPADLAEVAARLLAKIPDERYASATHMLHALGDTTAGKRENLWPPQAVGRRGVRARLEQAIEDIAERLPGRALFLDGEAGAGKTRLLDAVETIAKQQGVRVARGHCRPHDRPFGAWLGVYRALAPQGDAGVLASVFSVRDEQVVRERYPVISALRRLIADAAPVVVIVDDFENADAATVEAVEYLVRNTLDLSDESVAFVIGGRTPPPLQQVLSAALLNAPRVDHVALKPLTGQEVEELVASLLPRNPSLATPLARRLHEVSGGSPVFVADTLRSLVDQGVLIDDGDGGFRSELSAGELAHSRLPIPASLRQALSERLTPLDADAREVLVLLATSRRDLELDLVLKMVPFGEETAMRAIDQLVEAGMVVERLIGEDELVGLAEVRLRDLLLDELPMAVRLARHQHLGAAIEEYHRRQLGGVVEELAWHFEQAGIATKASTYLRRTAERHLNHSLYHEALGFLERALRLEPAARPLLLLEHADRELAEVHLDRSRALHALGQWSTGLQEARRAERVAALTMDTRLQSRVAAELGSQLRDQGDVDDAKTALRTALDKAAAIGDTALRPAPLYQLGSLLWADGDLDSAEACWREALTTAAAIRDERAIGMGYNGLGLAAFCKGSPVEARGHWEQAARTFEELGMLGPLSIARVNLSEVYLSTGILRKALQLAERAVAQAREMQHPHGMALGLAYRATALLEVGRIDDAVQDAREALELLTSLGGGDDDTVLVLATLVRVDLARNAPDRALIRVLELLPNLGPRDHEGLRVQIIGLHAEALARLGRFAESRAVLDRDGSHQACWPHVSARAHLYRARALRTLGDHQAAADLLIEGLELSERCGFRLFQLYLRQELAFVAPTEAARTDHARRAAALARSITANLSPADGRCFTARGWGPTAP